MLVLKNKDTNSLLKSEKSSFLRFLALYVTMITLLIVLTSLFYYQTQEKLFLAQQRATLTKYAYIQTKRLKVLHHYFYERKTYPRDERFKSAIYDIEFKKIFSLLENENVRFDEGIYMDNNVIHFVKSLDVYFLGAKYLVLEIKHDGMWRDEIWQTIIGYGLLAFVLFMLFGLYLAKLFLRPMRNSIMLLDRFIKDTTHELNTPLSAILANIEMMDTSVMVEKNRKKLTRINIAAKTVSTLYKDLTYLTLEQDKKNNDEEIRIKNEILDRIEYFDILAKSKNITIKHSLDDSTIVMDRRKFVRVLDNLLSNAIKYNIRGGKIEIILLEDYLTICDTGIGIAEEKIPFMFDRYMRFDKSEGGFGVGLSIVKKIVDEYAMKIDVHSKEGVGTRMVLSW
ncbi:MAG TPA: HAMP domain-containing histidine kinase [Sulfurovum sp.]|nr:HAMP domain-containing histidine kinase [Sulfurovum sp.]